MNRQWIGGVLSVFFMYYLSSQVNPNRFVISSMLNTLARSGCLEMGLMVHGLVVKSGLGVDRSVEVRFLDTYVKSRLLVNFL